MKTSKKINAGDTLTVGDLTDDHLGAVIEVETLFDITYRFTLGSLGDDWYSQKSLWTPKVRVESFYPNTQVKVITPPPVVQPDEPKILGQCIRIEGDDGWLGIVADTQGGGCRIWDTAGYWFHWDSVLSRADDRQIIVSDPPRWPDETPEVPERIETHQEWDAMDVDALYEWTWTDADGSPFGPAPAGGWSYSWLSKGAFDGGWTRPSIQDFPVTRGERVK